MKKTFTFNTGSYFEWHIKTVAAVFLLIGIGWVFSNVLGGLLMIFGGLVTFFTNYYFMINPEEKWYRDGVSVLGLKSGIKNQYRNIEYLFVKSNKVSRSYNSRVQSTTVGYIEFDGYIRFSESEKVHLFASKKKQEVVAKLTPLADMLGTQIVDYTREVTDVI